MKVIPYKNCILSHIIESNSDTFKVEAATTEERLGFQIKVPVKLGFNYNIKLKCNSNVNGKFTLHSNNQAINRLISSNQEFTLNDYFVARSATVIDFSLQSAGQVTINCFYIGNDIHNCGTHMEISHNEQVFVPIKFHRINYLPKATQMSMGILTSRSIVDNYEIKEKQPSDFSSILNSHLDLDSHLDPPTPPAKKPPVDQQISEYPVVVDNPISRRRQKRINRRVSQSQSQSQSQISQNKQDKRRQLLEHRREKARLKRELKRGRIGQNNERSKRSEDQSKITKSIRRLEKPNRKRRQQNPTLKSTVNLDGGYNKHYYGNLDPLVVIYAPTTDQVLRMKTYYQVLLRDFNFKRLKFVIISNDMIDGDDCLYQRLNSNRCTLVEVINYISVNLCRNEKSIIGFDEFITHMTLQQYLRELLEQDNTSDLIKNGFVCKAFDASLKILMDQIVPYVDHQFNKNQLRLLESLSENTDKINQINVSKSLKRFEHQIKQQYGLLSYTSKHNPALFFGCYNRTDYNKIRHHSNLAVIIWGGTDCNSLEQKKEIDIKYLATAKRIRHVAISEQIYQRLKHLFPEQKIYKIKLRLLDWDLYPKTVPLGDSVYIYTSDNPQRAKDIYGSDVYSEVIKRLPETNFIIAYGQYSKPEINNIYKRCFIGLRLTRFDGNANTVQELALLGRRCVHNGDYKSSLSWNNADDIVKIIESHKHQQSLTKVREDMIDDIDSNFNWLFQSTYVKN